MKADCTVTAMQSFYSKPTLFKLKDYS